jgi:hypothetical protein
MAIYLLSAVLAALILFIYLAKEPLPDWPINLIHLLTRH